MLSIAKAVTVLTLVAMFSVDKTTSECCHVAYISYHACMGIETEENIVHLNWELPDNSFEYWIRNEADKNPKKCISFFCADGSNAENKACGVGHCNMFKCDCVGGCRRNNGTSFEEMGKAWRDQHGLSMKMKYQLKGPLNLPAANTKPIDV